jgi:hypothetical protein
MSHPPLIYGPIPPYNNPRIEPRFFKPRRFTITAITLGVETLITTLFNNHYEIGQLCRLLIPVQFGSYQLNYQTGYVTALPAPNQVLININSLSVNVFTPNPTNLPLSKTLPQIIAIGDINSGYISHTGNYAPFTSIPGAFINISPL